ncbi:hypothetical protein BH09ACT10_BH09ACT10_24660 [soil metagenome]
MSRAKYAVRFLPLAVAAVLVLVAVFVSPATRSTARPPANVAVTQTTLACPLLESANDVALGQAVARSDAKTAAELRPGSSKIAGLTGNPGWLQQRLKPDGLASAVIRRVDPDGAGTVAFTSGVASAKLGGGLSLEQCSGARPESWFVGAGSTTRHFSTLRLTNLGDSRAVVDVKLFGVDGAVEVPKGKGIVLEAQEVRSIDLASIASGENELAVEVVAQRGAVASSMLDSSTSVFRGTDWNGSSASPSRDVTISGISAGAPGRTLLLANPGDDSATVSVNVVSAKGTAVLEGLNDVNVSAGSVKAVDLPQTIGADPVSLRLVSSAPLTASVRSSPTNVDFSYAAATEPLSGPSVVPLTLGKTFGASNVRIMAVPASTSVATTVVLEAFDSSLRSLGTTKVDLPAGETTTINPAKPGLFSSDAPAFIVLTPSAPAIAGMTVTAGSQITALPLRDAPLEVLAPSVFSNG